jgi:hypothetical protein
MVMHAAKGKFRGAGLAAVARIEGHCRTIWDMFLAGTVEQ